MSFNTSVSAFMVCVNELTSLKCKKQAVLEPLLVLLAPFAPHVTEELWSRLEKTESIHTQNWPIFNPEYLIENSFSYPISINGKTRTQIEFATDADVKDIEAAVLTNEIVLKWTEGKAPKKVIVVKNRIVNVVI
jgi:leucyl-tRNA synthetase